MLIETQDGFDYTGTNCCGWMHEAGFRETYVEQLTGHRVGWLSESSKRHGNRPLRDIGN